MRVRFDGEELENFFGNFKPLDITEEILEELGADDEGRRGRHGVARPIAESVTDSA